MPKDINDLQKIVLESKDRNELYATEIELIQVIAGLYANLNQVYSNSTRVRIKAQLSTAVALKEICKEGSTQLKHDEEREKNLANKINYNFRMAAKQQLTKETYNKIWLLANTPRQEVKEAKVEMRKNRLSE